MSGIAVGASRSLVVVDGLRRTQIVQYAGAAGDFNPVHTDETFAVQAGNPSVFSHGMLTMGMVGRVVTDWVGVERLRSYGVRFMAKVWPGDTITATAVVTGVTSDVAELAVTATNQRGEQVLVGSATVSVGGGTT